MLFYLLILIFNEYIFILFYFNTFKSIDIFFKIINLLNSLVLVFLKLQDKILPNELGLKVYFKCSVLVNFLELFIITQDIYFILFINIINGAWKL